MEAAVLPGGVCLHQAGVVGVRLGVDKEQGAVQDSGTEAGALQAG